MPVMVVQLVRVTAGLGAIARTEKGPSMRQYGNTREPINAIAATTSSVLSARVPRGRGAGTQSTALPLALALAHWHWQQVRHSAAKGARPPPPPTGCPTHPSENYREEIISRSESQCVGTGSAILTEFRRRGKHGGEHSEPKKRASGYTAGSSGSPKILLDAPLGFATPCIPRHHRNEEINNIRVLLWGNGTVSRQVGDWG